MRAAPPRKVLFIFRSPESSQSDLKCSQPSSGMWALLPCPRVTWHQRCRTERGLAVCSSRAYVATSFPPCSRLLSSEGRRRGRAGFHLKAAGRCAGPYQGLRGGERDRAGGAMAPHPQAALQGSPAQRVCGTVTARAVCKQVSTCWHVICRDAFRNV